MDMKTLVVGQNVFMRSGEVGNWGKVVEVTPTGVIVESDPAYGSELLRFDASAMAVDSSDLCNDKGVRGGLTIPTQAQAEGPWKLYSDPRKAGFTKTMDQALAEHQARAKLLKEGTDFEKESRIIESLLEAKQKVRK